MRRKNDNQSLTEVPVPWMWAIETAHVIKKVELQEIIVNINKLSIENPVYNWGQKNNQ